MKRISRRVLAIDLTSRGFGYVVLEENKVLVDWGVKRARKDKTLETQANVAELIRYFHPSLLILEDGTAKDSRRCERIKQLLRSIRELAKAKRVKSRSISSARVREMFGRFGAKTKHQIACEIARQLPDLAPYMPRRRKPWMNEDYHMATFDAAALALADFHQRR